MQETVSDEEEKLLPPPYAEGFVAVPHVLMMIVTLALLWVFQYRGLPSYDVGQLAYITFVLVFIWANMLCVGYVLFYCLYFAFYNLHLIFTGRGGLTVIGAGEEVVVIHRFFKFLAVVTVASVALFALLLDTAEEPDGRSTKVACVFLILVLCCLCSVTAQFPDKETFSPLVDYQKEIRALLPKHPGTARVRQWVYMV